MPNTLVDDANEDEFWYQTPKGPDMGGGVYQPGNSRGGGAKRPPMGGIGQAPRY